MAYYGRYKPINPGKYKGDTSTIVYRSTWERAVFKWCDLSEDVRGWSSEEIIIPYQCKTDKRVHRYFVDLYVQLMNGKTWLVEIKPKSQVEPPKRQTEVTKGYLREVLTYAKNVSKWKAAEQYALDRGWNFSIWTEDQIRALGINILT